ncbi:MAG TPA: acyltransferase family protein [Arenimonas sp.]|uniref:acyltransferase family protein n=1 Tax=Arenimonas sp. TaxID=1872635 RepID=UPI002D81078A|nr:acyltransferase family protein [Arenimonas sp.]HEU0152259.1 acyltransferase family protein [Arenimonas sp.]
MERRHDLDALRVLAFLLLIAYHCAMLYVAEWDWHLKSTHLAEWLQWPMLAMNRWRMALLFLISGLAIGLYQPARHPGRFAWDRTWRLLPPLLFGMFVVVSVQAYCQGVVNGTVRPGYLEFLWRYWQVKPWPEGGFDGAEYGITWNHLWYLAYLWPYSLLLAALLPLLESGPGRRLQAAFGGLRGGALVLLPALPLVVYLNVLLPRFEPTNDFIHDTFQHAQFFTVFLYGYVLARSRAFWDEVVRLRWPLGLAAASMCVVYVGGLKSDLAFGEPGLAAMRSLRGLRGLFVWTTLLAILGWARHGLDRPFRWLPYASEAVFPWYVIHQSATVVVAYWLVPRALPAWLEASLVVAGTVAACLLGNEVVRRIPWLRPLFGLKRRPRSGGAQPEAVAVLGRGE